MEYQLEAGVYRIKDFPEAVEQCKAFISAVAQVERPYKARTLIRKKKEEISDLRKAASKAVLAQFTLQCKELEKLLQDADDSLTETINAEKDAKPKPPVTKLTAKFTDPEKLQKATDFLDSLGIAWKATTEERN